MLTGNPTTFPRERAREVAKAALMKQLYPYQTWLAESYAREEAEGERQRCQYCRQVSENDARGGCVACGGPRAEYKPPKRILKNWRI